MAWKSYLAADTIRGISTSGVKIILDNIDITTVIDSPFLAAFFREEPDDSTFKSPTKVDVDGLAVSIEGGTNPIFGDSGTSG